MIPDRRLSALIVTAVLLVAGCSGGSDAAPTESEGSSASIGGDPVDGAFERNEGQTEQQEGSVVSVETDNAATTLAPEVTAVAEQASAETGDNAAGPASEDATVGGGDTTGNSSSTDGGGTTTGGATTGGATTGGATTGGATTGGATTGGATTGGATTGGAVIPTVAVSEPGTALVRIANTDYAFPILFCDIEPEGVLVLGEGTLPTGEDFEVEISYDLIDIDGDGAIDEIFDLFLDHLSVDGSDTVVPEFFTSKIASAVTQLGEDVTITRTGRHLAGTGSIVDFNGVAVPADESAAMAFDAFCA